jgi:hypothetical protein
VLIAWGGATVATSLGLRLPGSAARRFGFARVRSAAAWPPRNALAIGLLATVPCGWLYVFVAAAADGSPLDGALVMTAFWVGTVRAGGPGTRDQRALGPRPPDAAVTAAALVVLGLTVTGRIGPSCTTPPQLNDAH